MGISFGNGPALRLTFVTRAIEAKAEIFVITNNSNFRILHYGVRPVIGTRPLFRKLMLAADFQRFS